MQSRDFHSNRLTLTEVAEQLAVHPKTVQRWVLGSVRGKQLRSSLIGGRRCVVTVIEPVDRQGGVPERWPLRRCGLHQ